MIKITCDTTEACALLAELRARAFDNAFLIEGAGSTVRLRLAPTPAFEASLRKLW